MKWFQANDGRLINPAFVREVFQRKQGDDWCPVARFTDGGSIELSMSDDEFEDVAEPTLIIPAGFPVEATVLSVVIDDDVEVCVERRPIIAWSLQANWSEPILAGDHMRDTHVMILLPVGKGRYEELTFSGDRFENLAMAIEELRRRYAKSLGDIGRQRETVGDGSVVAEVGDSGRHWETAGDGGEG